jgi:hypothetical protein
VKKLYLVYDRVEGKVKKIENKEKEIEIADKDNPEYVVNCPNCGCCFGVN